VWLFRKCGPPLFVVFCDPVTEAGRHLGYTKIIEQQTHPQEVEDMEPITITTENFDAEVLHSEKPVLLDFWTSWCGPCRMLSPIVDEVAEERSDVKVGKVNVDEQPDLAAQFGVMSIPTLLVFQNGRLVNQAVGARPKSGVLALLDR
jgi:thioredoxin 1